jgi:ArsR family transcriptional regulator
MIKMKGGIFMPKDIYEIRASVFKALSHPTRLKILDLLSSAGEICVCDIVKELGVDQPTVSKHLSILKNAGIIDSRKEGLMVFYQLKIPCAMEFLRCVDNIIKADIQLKAGFLNDS